MGYRDGIDKIKDAKSALKDAVVNGTSNGKIGAAIDKAGTAVGMAHETGATLARPVKAVANVGAKGIRRGFKTTGFVAAAAAAFGGLMYLSSRAKHSRDVDHMPPPPDMVDQEPPSVPDMGGERRVLGPMTAKVMGVSGNRAAIQPDMMDANPVGSLSPN